MSEESKKKKSLVTTFTAEQALTFFIRCQFYRAETEEDRAAVLNEMIEDHEVQSAYTTDRTPEQWLADQIEIHGDIKIVRGPEDLDA